MKKQFVALTAAFAFSGAILNCAPSEKERKKEIETLKKETAKLEAQAKEEIPAAYKVLTDKKLACLDKHRDDQYALTDCGLMPGMTTADAKELREETAHQKAADEENAEPEELAKLGDEKDTHLVHGKQEYINALVDDEYDRDEAIGSYNESVDSARSAYIEEHGTHDGFNHTMLWFFIGHDGHPASVYYGSSYTRLRHLSGDTYHDSESGKLSLTSTQKNYLRLQPGSDAREDFSDKLASKPGARMRSSNGSTFNMSSRGAKTRRTQVSTRNSGSDSSGSSNNRSGYKTGSTSRGGMSKNGSSGRSGSGSSGRTSGGSGRGSTGSSGGGARSGGG